MKVAALEERVYRHRCVGGWYMVVPWVGYSLAELIRRAEPTGNAKYVEFTSRWDEAIMGNPYYKFPYIESLRLDEAMHALTLLCFGYYGGACCPSRMARRCASSRHGNTRTRAPRRW